MSAPEDHYPINEPKFRDELQKLMNTWFTAPRLPDDFALMHQREDNPPPPKVTYSEPQPLAESLADLRINDLRIPAQDVNGEWLTKGKMSDTLDVDIIGKAPHYNKHPSGIECIDIVRHMNFNLGNALKYIWRCDLKADAVEDLKKAIFYLEDEVKRREAQTP